VARERTITIEGLAPDVRDELEEYVVELDEGVRKDREIYQDFKLGGRGVTWEEFSRWADQARQVHRSRKRLLAASEISARMDSIAEQIRAQVDDSLNQDEADAVATERWIRSLRLTVQSESLVQAEMRAIEKHTAWKEDRRRKQQQVLEQVAERRGLDPETLAEIREKVVGL
jgi:hypothetical protein